jgi:UDP-N-acetylglucosamine 2-epimerase (non-hydrolysing)
MRVLHVVGARPNFMKAAPVYRALRRRGTAQDLVHTGQHYDPVMSGVFFRQLGLPRPTFHLGVGSGSHAQQTGKVLTALEPILLRRKPDWVLVYGDVNSTLAAALTSVKLGIKTAHVEAGLRSHDRSMPEEHNRRATDHLCDLLFASCADACTNLAAENIPAGRVRFVGNVMIDTLRLMLPKARRLQCPDAKNPFVLVTLHRPSNVDDPKNLSGIMSALGDIAKKASVLFPVHPRTRACLGKHTPDGVRLVAPVGYLEFLALQTKAALVITDSGGIQEETTCLGVPCLTVRKNTERPVTVKMGTNELVGSDTRLLRRRALAILSGKSAKKGRIPPLWDGRTGERIAKVLCGWKA